MPKMISYEVAKQAADAVVKAGGNRSQAARTIGVMPLTIANRLKRAMEYGIEVPPAKKGRNTHACKTKAIACSRSPGRSRSPDGDPSHRLNNSVLSSLPAGGQGRAMPPGLGELVPNVRKLASKIAFAAGPTVDADDLCQVGFIALMDVVRRYDPERNTKLWTFAQPRVRGAMQDYLRGADEYPRLRRRLSYLREQCEQQYLKERQRTATPDEVMKSLGWSHATYKQSLCPPTQSIDTPKAGRDEEDFTWASELADALEANHTESIEFAEEWKTVTKGVPYETSLMLYLHAIKQRTQKEIGEFFRLSESRVSQVLGEARKQIRRNILTEGDSK